MKIHFLIKIQSKKEEERIPRTEEILIDKLQVGG